MGTHGDGTRRRQECTAMCSSAICRRDDRGLMDAQPRASACAHARHADAAHGTRLHSLQCRCECTRQLAHAIRRGCAVYLRRLERRHLT